MKRYIDADKLIEVIEEIKKAEYENCGGVNTKTKDLQEVQDLIPSLQQEQPNLPSGEDVMSMCNQILIDWVKEGKTQEEREQREQAHSRFFELYDEYLMQDQPAVDFDAEYAKFHLDSGDPDDTHTFPIDLADYKDFARHFYELGLNAKKEQKPGFLPEFVWHNNTWPWGKSVRIIKSDGSAVVDMYFEDDKPGVCHISGLMVEESHRGKGFAKRLMDVCEDYCLEHGIFRIDLDSVLTDWVRSFYMRRGFLPIKESGGFMKMYKILKKSIDI